MCAAKPAYAGCARQTRSVSAVAVERGEARMRVEPCRKGQRRGSLGYTQAHLTRGRQLPYRVGKIFFRRLPPVSRWWAVALAGGWRCAALRVGGGARWWRGVALRGAACRRLFAQLFRSVSVGSAVQWGRLRGAALQSRAAARMWCGLLVWPAWLA
jgi:hypothetical protein